MTSADILAGLQGIGVRPGMRLMVHSSLSSFGWVEGGADSVIEALIEAVGKQGTILMPSFNHGAPFREGGPGVFDPTTTPTTNGRIPEQFWRRADVSRSLNPTHPFAAWGRDAQRYLGAHHRTLTMGEDSPLGRITRDGGYQLNLGTTHATTTAKHLAETLHRSPCLGYRTEAHPVRFPDGEVALVRTWGWREQSCPLTESGEILEREMNARGLQNQICIGPCAASFFRLTALIQVVWNLLENGYDEFPPCSGCPIRPRRTQATRPSDWVEDPEALAAARGEILSNHPSSIQRE